MSSHGISAKESMIEIRRFYLALSLLMAVLATIGFWPQYFRPLMSGGVAADTAIHIHAAVYVGWLGLFIFQCLLVAVGNIRLHRRIGNLGFLYGIGVVVMGLSITIARFTAKLNDGGIAAVEHTSLAPATDMILFSVFFAAAAYSRFNPERHKRLMIVAATSLLIPSIARFVGSFELEPAIRHTVRLLLWLSPIYLAFGYDIYSRRLAHPTYIIGAIVITLFNFRSPLQYTDTWVSITHWLASIVD
ncbi:hypothetical protein R0135_01160 [Congregibacter variabilis]|uniref:Uncharacterized protein n=1 Tax=Congregibacter variabilis TaxID=3081200 RepID=A0ABZ0I3P4_9GAMM|nr:hypothetical protein R0135_01160 [Congregibacter sp. IMCC43200]